MAKLKMLPPRLKAAPQRLRELKPAGATGASYGRGRGGRPWRRLRARVLQRDGELCQPCYREGRLTLAAEVDHIVPLSQGGGDHAGNLEAICKRCHAAKTAEEAGAARRR